ncbi:MAG TPA: ATP-binding cassette domain-containing protein [Candidatus Sulfotelmatobacter sp.]
MSKHYIQRAPFSRTAFRIDALVNVNLEIASGCLTALVGESGSGKSTLASCLAMLEKPNRGEIWFEGKDLTSWSNRKLGSLRPRIQMVFQDSAGALNPRSSAEQIIEEPLEIQRRESGQRLHTRARELMGEVGLSPDLANRSPMELSGGQRQRLAIARAIALDPSLLILDESLSGLDLSTQAHILNLVLDLKENRALTAVLISHDLSLVGQVADFIAVMHQGRIVEYGSTAQVLGSPQHPQTSKLLASVRLLESAFRAASAGAGV